ncbi:hypothetical protein HBI65_217840 [Parastagonospora nodorum]|nr:hypothetical protein HBI65_217840 [Parastagonospora nodorum]
MGRKRSKKTALARSNARIGLCDICAGIPWETLLDLRVSKTHRLPKINQTVDHLRVSSCRVCRLIAHAMISNKGGEFVGKPPYILDLHGSVWSSTGALVLLYLDKPNLTSSGRFEIPHMVLVSVQPKISSGGVDARPPADRLVLGGIPIVLMKESIDVCKRDHGNTCTPKDSTALLGLKLIDCLTNTVMLAPRAPEYVALSYVWGRRNNGISLADAAPLSSPPKTVSDGCYLARSLGFRYLWVDRYCIDQENHAERTQQIAQMADIYASAQLVLLAVGAKDADFAFPISDHESTHSIPQETVGDVKILSCAAPLRHITSDDLEPPKWASRAWTFQECYFSRRQLLITKDKVLFRCNGRNREQVVGNDWYPPTIARGVGLDLEAHKRVLSGYAGRQLTFESDALAAVVGALNAHKTRKSCAHIWGVPVSRSRGSGNAQRIALIWAHDSPCERRKGFPSWSPIAWTGPISWPSKLDVSTEGVRLVSDVEDRSVVSWATLSKSKHRDYENAPRFLEITGGLAPLNMVRTTRTDCDMSVLAPEIRADWISFSLKGDLEVMLEPRWDLPSAQISEDPIYGLLLTSRRLHDMSADNLDDAHVMILRRCHKCYERVGFLTLPSVLEKNHIYKKVQFGEQGTLQTALTSSDDSPPNLFSGSGERYDWAEIFEEDTIVLG